MTPRKDTKYLRLIFLLPNVYRVLNREKIAYSTTHQKSVLPLADVIVRMTAAIGSKNSNRCYATGVPPDDRSLTHPDEISNTARPS